jgi:hypothetical protein
MCYIQEGNVRYDISAISRREQAKIWCDDDDEDDDDDNDVRRLLDQHA